MMMRPRNYSTLNRAVAKAISHSVNDYYRQRERQKKYNNLHNVNNQNSNNHNNSSDYNNTSDGTLALTIIACILVGLAIAIPEIMLFYLIVGILLFVCVLRIS